MSPASSVAVPQPSPASAGPGGVAAPSSAASAAKPPSSACAPAVLAALSLAACAVLGLWAACAPRPISIVQHHSQLSALGVVPHHGPGSPGHASDPGAGGSLSRWGTNAAAGPAETGDHALAVAVLHGLRAEGLRHSSGGGGGLWRQATSPGRIAAQLALTACLPLAAALLLVGGCLGSGAGKGAVDAPPPDPEATSATEMAGTRDMSQDDLDLLEAFDDLDRGRQGFVHCAAVHALLGSAKTESDVVRAVAACTPNFGVLFYADFVRLARRPGPVADVLAARAGRRLRLAGKRGTPAVAAAPP